MLSVFGAIRTVACHEGGHTSVLTPKESWCVRSRSLMPSLLQAGGRLPGRKSVWSSHYCLPVVLNNAREILRNDMGGKHAYCLQVLAALFRDRHLMMFLFLNLLRCRLLKSKRRETLIGVLSSPEH